jgi:hypothetical protein
MVDRSGYGECALDLAELGGYVGIIGAQWTNSKRGQLRSVSDETTRYLACVKIPLLVTGVYS